MSSPNDVISSGNKRTFGSMSHQEPQQEINRHEGEQDAASQLQRKARKIEHHGKIDADAHDPNIKINQNLKDPFEAAFEAHQQTTQGPSNFNHDAKFYQTTVVLPGDMDVDAHDPNIIIDQNLKNPFEAAFEAHQKPPQDPRASARDVLYHRSIAAPPGEWTTGLPFHQEGWKRVDNWIDDVLPPDMDLLKFWDDIEGFATKQRYIPGPVYDADSPIGKLERYRWMGHPVGDPLFEAPVLWAAMLIREKQAGGNILQDLDERQKEIAKTKERQACVT